MYIAMRYPRTRRHDPLQLKLGDYEWPLYFGYDEEQMQKYRLHIQKHTLWVFLHQAPFHREKQFLSRGSRTRAHASIPPQNHD